MFKGENDRNMKHGLVESKLYFPQCLAETEVPIWRRRIYVLIIREMCRVVKMDDSDFGERCIVENVGFTDFGKMLIQKQCQTMF